MGDAEPIDCNRDRANDGLIRLCNPEAILGSEPIFLFRFSQFRSRIDRVDVTRQQTRMKQFQSFRLI
jgi:hypothetical protein